MMFCNQCGSPIDDDQILCEQCASTGKVNDEAAVDVPTEEFALNTSGQNAPKKSKGIRLIVIAAVVAVLAVAVVLLWKPILGLFGGQLKFDTPQEHFSYVEGKAADSLSDSVTAVYGSLLAQYEKTESAAEAEIHILLGDQLQNLIGTYLGAVEELDLSWLSDIMIKVDSTGSTKIGQALLTLGLGDAPVVSADVIVDASELMLWATIPELSGTYLKMDLQEMMDASGAEYDPAYMTGLVEALPSEQVVNELLNKYSQIVFSQITKVESKEQTVTVGQVSQTCTALVATIDESTLNQIAIAVLEEAKKDEKLLDAVKELAGFVSEEDGKTVAQEWEQAIDDALADVRASQQEASTENYMLLTDYVDSKHNIIGRRVTFSDEEEQIYYLSAVDGDSFAFEADVMDGFAVTGSGTNVKGVVNAEYTLDVEGTQTASIQLVDMNGSKGTVRIVPTADLIEQVAGVGLQLDLVLELVLDGSSAEDHVALNVLLDSELFVGITAQVIETEASAVTAPSEAVDAMDEEALTQWVADFRYDKLLKNLKSARLPQELLDAVEQLVDMLQ